MKFEKLYRLSFFSDTEEDFGSGFDIGLFAAWEDAEQVALRYRKEVPGFKDHDCDYSIMGIPVYGDMEIVDRVYIYQGWNWDEDHEEVDCIISSCFASKVQAEEALDQAQRNLPRQEWVLNCHIIGQCDWQEGFVREWR